MTSELYALPLQSVTESQSVHEQLWIAVKDLQLQEILGYILSVYSSVDRVNA